MKIIHTKGDLEGQIEDKPIGIARRLITIGNARVPTAEEIESAPVVGEDDADGLTFASAAAEAAWREVGEPELGEPSGKNGYTVADVRDAVADDAGDDE